ncbi:MAG: ROK family protein [Phycisphaerales bacterium]
MAKGKSKPVIGIDLGGTNMQIGAVTADFKIAGRSKKKTRATEGLAKVIERICDGVQEACGEAGIKVKDCGALGIGAPGAIEPHNGVVLMAPNLRWTDVPLAAILRKKLGIPVVVDNDVNVAVLGEHRLGAGKGVSDMMGLWLGTGVGGGFIFNGQLYYGANFTAGEVGHTMLFPHNPPGSRKVEDNCSRTAVVDRILRLIRNNKSIIPELADNNLAEVRAKTVSMAYARKDKVTVDVINNVAELLGIVCATYVTALSLPMVVLGGGLAEAMGEALAKPVREHTRRLVFPESLRNVQIVCTRLEADAGLLGAAIMAHELLDGTAAASKKASAAKSGKK